MRLSILCVALCMGVVYARPEGEVSPVSPPEVIPAEETVADPKPAEDVSADEDAARPKRWYSGRNPFYNPGFHYPNNLPNNFDMFPSGSIGSPVVPPGISSRTRYASDQARMASFEELASFVENQRSPNNNNNLPSVIDTAGFNNQQRFNQGFNQPGFNPPGFNRPGFNPPGFNRPGFNQPGFNQPGFNQPGLNQPGFNQPGFNQPDFNQQRFNQGSNQPGFNQGFINEVETTTRFPQLRTSSAVAYPNFVPSPTGFQGQRNNGNSFYPVGFNNPGFNPDFSSY